MALGYEGNLYILAFDHRGSFQKKMFGIEGDPTPEQTETITDAKTVISEGFRRAVDKGAPKDAAGLLVDEQFGADVARTRRRIRTLRLSCCRPPCSARPDDKDGVVQVQHLDVCAFLPSRPFAM